MTWSLAVSFGWVLAARLLAIVAAFALAMEAANIEPGGPYTSNGEATG